MGDVARRVELRGALGDLARAERGERVREAPQLGRSELGGDAVGVRQQHVAAEHGGVVAPQRVRARAPAPQRRRVEHVVVVERGEVQQLDRGRRVDHALADCLAPADRHRRADDERRPQPLAAGLDPVQRDLGEPPSGVGRDGAQT